MAVDPEKIRRLIAGHPSLPVKPAGTENQPVDAAPVAQRKGLPMCINAGSPAPPPNGKPTAKTFYNCDAGLGVVCRCMCHPSKCALYEADE